MGSVSQVRISRFQTHFSRYTYAYLLLIPGIVATIVFRYIPMYGLIIAFERFRPGLGVFRSKWVWFENFIQFFSDPYSWTLIRNTFLLGFYTLIFGFPVSILLALSFNEVRNYNLKRFAQTLSYLPYFISTVIIVGILKEMSDLHTGIFNALVTALGGKPIQFFAEPGWFRPIYIFSGIWQGAGFGSIIYLAAIAGVDVELYEAAIIDGSSRFKNLLYITLPCIMPTIIVMFILAVGGILGNDFTKILLIYTGSTYDTADVLQTYVYRMGIQGAQFGHASAVGILNAVVSFMFLYAANYLSRRYEGSSLW